MKSVLEKSRLFTCSAHNMVLFAAHNLDFTIFESYLICNHELSFDEETTNVGLEYIVLLKLEL